MTHQGTLAGQWHQQMAWDPLGMQSEHREARADGSSTLRFFLYGPGNLRFLTGIQEHPAGGPPGAIRREIDVRNQAGKVLRRWIVNGWGSGQNMVHDRDYVYDQTGPLATRLGDAQATRRYFFKDHLGSTRVVTNQHGQPDFGYQNYYPFGEEIQHPLAQVDDRLCKFTNHEREAHGQSHYMLGRHYAQNLQRFLSPDPARDGWNLYGYVGNNPLKFVDPTGMYAGASNEELAAAHEALTPEQKEQFARAQTTSLMVTGGVALAFTPGPEDAAFAVAATTKLSGRISAGFSRLGGAIKRIFGRGDEVVETAQDVASAGKGQGLSTNPFAGKTPQQIDEGFRAKGFEPRGPDPVAGKGGYINPQSGRSYHIDPEPQKFKRGTEAPHVDVNRPRGYQGPLVKRKYPLGKEPL